LRATQAPKGAIVPAVKNASTVDGHIDAKRCADKFIAAMATRQHGVVSRAQLLEAGLSGSMVESRRRRGLLIGVRRGVYAVGHSALTERGRWMAAVLTTGSGAVLSHRSAAKNWDLPGGHEPEFELTATTTWRSPRGVRVYRNRISADEIEVREGIPTTSVTRTILDLAAVAAFGDVRRTFHEAERRGLTSVRSLPDLVARYPRRPGLPAIARLLAAAGAAGVTRSELEDRFREFLERQGLPRPELNALVEAGGRRFELDCVWRRAGVAVELDGRAAHGTDRAFEADRGRDRCLSAHGWRVLRVTWRALHEEPELLETELRSVLPTTLGR
jgi:hypothetical protein